ncbi:inositol 2-dehydrogenase [Auraticoccus sp. F435]|uniref:Inositol 2-dehydrogenase n=1 Tax=Auraticoccus cholistanensis TaxID=2656650 RepID=A0A6A9UZ19_9ACTN|nr:inositol 2-dehydrogenase [Auraticoccus cholistanensis]
MLNVAVIGAGRIGRVHARSVLAHPGTRLALVADASPVAAREVAESAGTRWTDQVDDVFADDQVDAVVVASPTPFHVDHIVAGVASGKAVLTEKPVDLDLRRVDACLEQIRGSEHRVMVGFNRRFDAGIQEIRQRVLAGDVGEVEQVVVTSRDPSPPSPEYIASSGGIFRDMTIHDLDMVRFLVGEVATVQATGHQLDPVTGDHHGAVLVLTARSGALATIVNSRHNASGYDQRVEVVGPRGALSQANHRPTAVSYSSAEFSDRQRPWVNFFLERYAQAYAAELDAFVRAVRTGEAPSPGIADGRAALLLADCAVRSAATGRAVAVEELDPATATAVAPTTAGGQQ